MGVKKMYPLTINWNEMRMLGRIDLTEEAQKLDWSEWSIMPSYLKHEDHNELVGFSIVHNPAGTTQEESAEARKKRHDDLRDMWPEFGTDEYKKLAHLNGPKTTRMFVYKSVINPDKRWYKLFTPAFIKKKVGYYDVIVDEE